MPTNFPSWGHGREGLESHFREKLQIPNFWSRVRPSSLSLCPVLGSFAPSRVRPTFTYLRTSGLGGEYNNCQFVPCHALSMPRQHSFFLQGIGLLSSCFGLLVRQVWSQARNALHFITAEQETKVEIHGASLARDQKRYVHIF